MLFGSVCVVPVQVFLTGYGCMVVVLLSVLFQILYCNVMLYLHVLNYLICKQEVLEFNLRLFHYVKILIAIDCVDSIL